MEGGSGNAEEEEQMDYENQHFYNENDYTNLQKKHEKQQYEVYEVENNQEDGDEGEGLEGSERKINKSPHESNLIEWFFNSFRSRRSLLWYSA